MPTITKSGSGKKKVTKPPTSVKPSLALVKKTGSEIVTPTQSLAKVGQALTQMVNSFSKLTTAEMPEAIATLKSYEGVLEAAKVNLTDKLRPYIKEHGTVETDKGTLRTNIGAWTLDLQPTRTGYDSKKTEAVLRAKNIEVERGMDAIVTYKANAGKLETLAKETTPDGQAVLFVEDLEAMRYEPNFKVVIKKAGEAAVDE